MKYGDINLLSPTSSILPSPVNNAHKHTKFWVFLILNPLGPTTPLPTHFYSPFHSTFIHYNVYRGCYIECFCFLSSIILSTHFKDDFICAVLINPPRTPIITMLPKPVTSTFLNWWSVFTVIILFNLSTTLDSPDQLSPLRLSCFSSNLTSCNSSIYFDDSSSFSPSLSMGVHLNFIFSILSTVFPRNIIQSHVFKYRHTGDFQICIFSLDLTSGLQTLFCSLLYPHNLE